MNQSTPKDKKLAIRMFIYWAVLMVWQNFLTYNKASDTATIIKVGLLLFLCVSFFSEGASVKSGAFCVWALFFVDTLLTMLLNGEALVGRNTIYYLFPAVFFFLTLLVRADYQIDKKQFLLFLYCVIITVVVMVLYGIIYMWDYYAQFLSRERAYGSELSSFLISSHEYGMYLVFGITAVIIWYQSTDRPGSHALALVLLLVFGVNLFLTLSRTAFLAALVLISAYILTSTSKGTRKWFLIVIFTMLLVTFLVPGVLDFVQRILLKENNDAGRFEMWNAAIEKYNGGTLMNRFFGFGNTEISNFTKNNFAHTTVHNSYLQVLLVWGLTGLLFLITANIYSIVHSVRLFRYDRNMAAVFLALSLSQIAFMFTNTACLFQSVIDSYMLTVFTLVVPRYVGNSIIAGTYEEALPAETEKKEPEQ